MTDPSAAARRADLLSRLSEEETRQDSAESARRTATDDRERADALADQQWLAVTELRQAAADFRAAAADLRAVTAALRHQASGESEPQ